MAELPGKDNPSNFFLRLRPIHRILIAAVVTAIVLFSIRNIVVDTLVRMMVGWDVFACAVLILAWIVIFTCSPAQIRAIARREDGSRGFVLLLVLLSSLASLVTVLFLIFSKNASPDKGWYVAVSIAGMLLAWVLVHTIFSFHYAYMYYDDDEGKPEVHAGGLDFPDDDAPDYLDFAYFSFVIGMTFQVSDVEISAKRIRRQALVHGLLAFVLNTFVVALTVNLVAGLK